MTGKVRFGDFEFDPERRELRKHGLGIRVPHQSLTILAVLVERPGETVTRDRIQRELWPHGTIVGYKESINSALKRLRLALRDPADKSYFIERVRGQGYRFIAPIERLEHAGMATAQDDRAGAMLLHYRVVERVGAGSMGEVWKAEDTKLGRTVALKFVPQRLAADAAALAAFRREAQHAASLNHPNICTIHSLEEHDGQHFLVMEYIDGCPLTAVLEGAPLSAQRIVDIGILHAVLHQEPQGPRSSNPALSRELERIIPKALGKDVSARW